MTSLPDPRLQRLLGGAILAPLRLRLRRHFGVPQAGQNHGAYRPARIERMCIP